MLQDDQQDRTDTLAPACSISRFRGPEADEVFLVCRPEAVAGSQLITQTESIYRTLYDALRAEGGDVRHVVRESIFLRDIEADLPEIQELRDDMLRELSGRTSHPALTFIGQPPLNDAARLEISVCAVIPRRHATKFGHTRWNQQPCQCAPPSRFAARIVRLGTQDHLYAGGIRGNEGNPFDETTSMLRVAEEALQREGLCFQHVVRTWFHLRDLARDFPEFDRARRDFFAGATTGRLPASTTVQGTPYPHGHAVTMSLYAIKSPEPSPVRVLPARGAPAGHCDILDGIKVVDANKVALHLPWIASVDEAGRSLHRGDFTQQAERMLDNLVALLAAQDASIHELLATVTYVKNPSDGPRLRQILHSRGLDGIPNVLVQAVSTRPELLCAMEGLAALERSDYRR